MLLKKLFIIGLKMSFKLLKLSRLILSALIVIAFLYKSVYGSIQSENVGWEKKLFNRTDKKKQNNTFFFDFIKGYG